MTKKEIVIIADYAHDELVTLQELSELCNISADLIEVLIKEGIIEPLSGTSQDYLFGTDELQRVKMVVRLQRDLQVNLEGVALVLDLLDEVKELRARMQLVERHYLKHK